MSEHLKVYNTFKGTTRSDNMMAYFRNGKLNVHITQANVKRLCNLHTTGMIMVVNSQ